MDVNSVTAGEVEITYEASGPDMGQPVLLLHGWPDDPRTFDAVVPKLNAAAGAPSFPTGAAAARRSSSNPESPRTGETAALATDILAFMDALGFSRLPVVGHDWGGRVAYLLAAARPQRVASIAALSVPWAPGRIGVPPLPQVRAFWYQWFMNTAPGAAFVRENPLAFAREQWVAWSPPGPWFTDEIFSKTAPSLQNPDWAAVTLNFYRSRWGADAADPRFADLTRDAEAAAASRCRPWSSTARPTPACCRPRSPVRSSISPARTGGWSWRASATSRPARHRTRWRRRC